MSPVTFMTISPLGPKPCNRCNILSVRVLHLLPLLLTLALRAPADAQQASASLPTASAIGTVFDSIRMRPLVGARVRLDTTSIDAITDAVGRFHLEGIPPGAHSLRVEHPVVDTIGIVLGSPPELYAAGESKAQELATPSPETLVELLCSPAWRARGRAALMGRVYEADTGTPATGAKVSLVWYEIDLTGGVRRAPRVREAIVGPGGIYRICGLPAQLEGRAQVLRGMMTSGDIPIVFGQDVLALRSMSIAAPGAVAAAPTAGSPDSSARGSPVTVLGRARLTGRVLNKAGHPLVGARVQLDGTTRAATTRTTGDFTLDSLPSGTQTVTVRLLGYAPIERAVDLSAREPQSVTLTLENFVPVLEAVRVNAQRERALDDIGYARRKRAGQGWFVEGDRINRNSQNFSDVLRGAPGIRVTQSMNRQVIQSSRDPMGGCVNIWVDGTQWQQMEPGDVDDFVKPHELGAIEVYSPSTTPAEYQPAGRSSCSTIVAWTSRRLERKR